MTPEVNERLDQWCDALESGEFLQGKRNLSANHRYCCLGVACELFHDIVGLPKTGGKFGCICYGIDSKTLPEKVMEFLGLAECNGEFFVLDLDEDMRKEVWELLEFEDEYTSLSVLNDQGAPFSLIARIIRSRPNSLFK